MPGATIPELTRLPLSVPVPRMVPRLVSVLTLRPPLEGVPMLRIGAGVGCGTAPISITPLLVLKFSSTSSPARTDTVPEFWARPTLWTPADVFLNIPAFVKPVVEMGTASVPVSSIVPALELVSCPLVSSLPVPPTVTATWLLQLPSTLTAPPVVMTPVPVVNRLPRPPGAPTRVGVAGAGHSHESSAACPATPARRDTVWAPSTVEAAARTKLIDPPLPALPPSAVPVPGVTLPPLPPPEDSSPDQFETPPRLSVTAPPLLPAPPRLEASVPLP